MNSIQSALALPELKRTETRQALTAVFEMYREYKQILDMGGNEPGITQVLPHSIDKDGTDPNLIRVEGKFNSSTENCVTRNEKMLAHIHKVDRAVNKMYPDRREIIKRKFLCDMDPIPSDEEVHESMCEDGYAMGLKTWRRRKAKALWSLAMALGVEKMDFRDNDC